MTRAASRAPRPPNVWEEVLERIRPKINIQSFQTWFSPTRLIPGAGNNGTLRVEVPSADFKAQLEAEWQGLVNDALEATTGHPRRVLFEVLEIEAPAETEPEPEEPEEPARPAEIEHCPDVPEVCWRGDAKAYRDLVGPCIESSDNFQLAGFLTLIGAALGKAVHLRIPRTVYLNNYTVLVGPSSYSAKGTAMGFLMDLQEAICDNIFTITAVASYEGMIEDLKQTMEGDSAGTPKGPPSAMIVLDEFNSLMRKGESQGSILIPQLKYMYDNPNKPLKIPTRQNPVRLKRNPLFSMFAASELDDLVDVGDRNLKTGLGNRILYIPGNPKPPLEGWHFPDVKAMQDLVSRLRATLNFWWELAGKQPSGSVELFWSDKAERAWWKWYRSYRSRGATDPLVAKLSVRDRPHLRKTAGLYAAIDRSPVVDLEHFEAAEGWIDFLLQGRYHIFRTAGVRDHRTRESLAMVEYVKGKPNGVGMSEFYGRFTRMDPRDRESCLSYLLADPWHPERPLRKVQRIGKKKMANWLIPMTDEMRQDLLRERMLREGKRG